MHQDDSEEGDTVIAVNSRVLPDAHKMKSSDPTCSGNRQPAALAKFIERCNFKEASHNGRTHALYAAWRSASCRRWFHCDSTKFCVSGKLMATKSSITLIATPEKCYSLW
jgi:hypothetical protein